MECPKCGYLMDEFTKECPRCARMAAQAAAAPRPPPSALPAGGYGSVPPRTSGLAIASLITAIVSPCTCGIAALVSLVLGIIALIQINNDQERLKGFGLAVSGVVISAIVIAGAIALSASGINTFQKMMGSSEGKEGMAISLEQQLNTGVRRFHVDTGVYPVTLTDLVATSGKSLVTKVPPGSYHGPYVVSLEKVHMGASIGNTDLPANPLVDKNDPVVAHHWKYDKTTGVVTSAVTLQNTTYPSPTPAPAGR